MQTDNYFPDERWYPSADLSVQRKRAILLRQIRAFFDARNVLEVDTPLLSLAATVDCHIESFSTGDRWLQTSPEFAMKRLLAAGSGCIWQLCKVFRLEEAGRFHNPEFSLLEWYRIDFEHHQLMDELEALLKATTTLSQSAFERLSYREAFLRHIHLDVFTASANDLRIRANDLDIVMPVGPSAEEVEDKDFWLDLLMSHRVAPQLGQALPCFIYDFPASQAALARVCGDVAERFELIWKGVELANGFHELTDPLEQARRFAFEQERRRARSMRVPPADQNLIGAMHHGLPDCAGVAVGIDRLLMLSEGAAHISGVLSFGWDRA